MNRLVLVISMLFAHAHADDMHTVCSHALDAYERKEYAQALDLFLAIEPTNPTIWYYAGNAAYEQHAYGKAALYWLRALHTRDAALHQGAVHNYTYMQTSLGHEIPLFMRVRWYIQLLSCYVPLGILELLLVLLWIALYYMRHRLQYVQRITQLLVGLSVLVLWMAYMMPDDHRLAVVTDDAVVYAGPNQSFYQLASLQQAELVTVHTTTPDWYKIQQGSLIGWVAQHKMELVEH